MEAKPTSSGRENEHWGSVTRERCMRVLVVGFSVAAEDPGFVELASTGSGLSDITVSNMA